MIYDILQVTDVNSCPRLVTPSNPYTLHMSVNEQLVISGSNFNEVCSYLLVLKMLPLMNSDITIEYIFVVSCS